MCIEQNWEKEKANSFKEKKKRKLFHTYLFII